MLAESLLRFKIKTKFINCGYYEINLLNIYFWVNLSFLVFAYLSFHKTFKRYALLQFILFPNYRPCHLQRLYYAFNGCDVAATKNYFVGKRVAIIGNAESLSSQNYGADIDKYDIVIRINRANIIDEKIHGSKTSVWVTSHSYQLSDEVNKYDICLWMTPLFYIKDIADGVKYFANRSMIVAEKTFIISINSYFNLINLLNAVPTTGMMALQFLLETSCKEIAVFGFDFFATQNIYEKKDVSALRHDFAAEKEYFMNVVRKDTRVLFNK